MDTTNDVILNMINLMKCFKIDVDDFVNINEHNNSKRFSLYNDGIKYEIILTIDGNVNPNVSLVTLLYMQEFEEYVNYDLENNENLNIKNNNLRIYKKDSFWIPKEYINSFITLVSTITTLINLERKR